MAYPSSVGFRFDNINGSPIAPFTDSYMGTSSAPGISAEGYSGNPDDLHWHSSNKNVCSVFLINEWNSGRLPQSDVTGADVCILHGYGAGSCTITCTDSSGASISFGVNVGSGGSVAATSISLSPLNLSAQLGQPFELTATVYPSNATDSSVTWSNAVNNTNYFVPKTESKTGNVTKATFQASQYCIGDTIIATDSAGHQSACTVDILGLNVLWYNERYSAWQPLSTLEWMVLNNNPASYQKTVQLKADVMPEELPNKAVTWSRVSGTSVQISNTTADSCTLTAVSKGITTIKCQLTNGVWIQHTIKVGMELESLLKKPEKITLSPGQSRNVAGGFMEDGTSYYYDYFSIAAKVLPASEEAGTTYSFGTSDSTIAAIAAPTDGTKIWKLGGLSPGTTYLNISARNDCSSINVTIPIEVVYQPTSVVVEPSPVTVDIVNTQALSFTATVTPASADQTVTWSSSNPAIISAEAGPNFTVHDVGVCYIVATAVNGVHGSATVTVTSSAKDILTFVLDGVDGVIDQVAQTITVSFDQVNKKLKDLPPTITVSPHAVVEPPSGQPNTFYNPVEYVVTALDGSTKIYTVTVITPPDTTKPVITLLGPAEMTVDEGSAWNDPGTSVWDPDDSDLTASASGDPVFNINKPGTYYIHYNCKDAAGNEADEVIRIVHVLDVTPPVITLIGGDETHVLAGETYVEQGATAIDNVDGDISYKIKIEGSVNSSTYGTYYVKYSVSDSAGNYAEKIRTVKVDPVGPVITLIGKSYMVCYQNEEFEDPGATVYDATDPGLGYTTSGTIDWGTCDIYTIKYNAMDALGNRAREVTRTVEIRKDPLQDIVDELKKGNEYMDPNAVQQLKDIKEKLDEMANNPDDPRWDDIVDPLITPPVVDALGPDPVEIKKTLIDFLKGIGDILFSDTEQMLAEQIKLFRTSWEAAFDKLFNSDGGHLTIDDFLLLYIEARKQLPIVLAKTDNNYYEQMVLASDPSLVLLTVAAQIDAMKIAMTVPAHAAIVSKLNHIGWTAEILGMQQREIARIVDPTDKCIVNIANSLIRSNAHLWTLTDGAETMVPKAANGTITITPPTPTADPQHYYLDIAGKWVTSLARWSASNLNNTIAFDLEGAVITPRASGKNTIYIYRNFAGSNPQAHWILKFDINNTMPDTEPPVIILNEPVQMELPINSAFIDPGCIVKDNRYQNIEPVITGVVDTSKPGVYYLRYNATDVEGNQAEEKVRTINIMPREVTGISVDNDSVAVAIDKTVLVKADIIPPNATDQRVTWESEDPTIATVAGGVITGIKLGSTVVVATASNGMAATVQVAVFDDEAPVITLNGADEIIISIGGTFADPGATVNDNIDESLQATVFGIVNTAVEGTYTLKYSAVDSAGNEAIPVNRTVIVKPIQSVQ